MPTDAQKRTKRFRILLGACGAAAFVLSVIAWLLVPSFLAFILGFLGVVVALVALAPLPFWSRMAQPGPSGQR